MAKKLPSKYEPMEGEVGVDYARYSSHNQRDVSIEQQVEACLKYAEQLGITLIESYEDRAVTGKTDKRPNFQRMLKDAEKGKFQYVIAWKSNRMGRNMMEAMINEARLQAAGVRVLYVEEDFDDTAAGRFALRSMMNVNQFYSENMAEDVMRGLMDNASRCMVNGPLPFGYIRDDNMKFKIDEPKADVVKEIYTKVACGEPFVDIADSLNKRGIKTRTGSDWGRSSFHSIIKNERYRGVYIYNDIRIEGGIPRIISDELFFKVQEVLKTKKNAQGRHRTNGDYLLTGKLFCGKCESPMIGVSGTSKTGALHHYYVCQKKRTEHSCDKANIRRDDIEFTVAQAIKKYVLTQETIEVLANKTVEYNKKREDDAHISILKDRLADVKKSTKNLLSAIEQGIVTETTKSRLLELEKEQSDINAKISAAKADIITVSKEDIVIGLSVFKDGDIENKKYQASLFDTFLVAVYVYDDHLKIVFSLTKNTVTVPLHKSEIENAENKDEIDSSFKLPNGSPPPQRVQRLAVFLAVFDISATK